MRVLVYGSDCVPGYRYPRGESYFDIIARLNSAMHELETYEEPVVIVSHQASE